MNGVADISLTKRVDQRTYYDLLVKRLQAKYEERGGPTAQNCSLFWTTSTVPGTGLGIFAGRSYEAGSVLEVSRRVCPPQRTVVQATTEH